MSNFFVAQLKARKQGIPANDFAEKYFLKALKNHQKREVIHISWPGSPEMNA
jgi:hypothetical protein